MFAQWNNADITAADPDIDALRRWYEARDVPWGVRVPVEFDLDLGAPVFVKRAFGMRRSALSPAPDAPGVRIWRAGPGEADRFIAAGSALFGDPLEVSAAWISPVFGRDGFEHWLAELAGDIVGACTAVWSRGAVGRAVMLTGLIGEDEEDSSLLAALATAVLDSAFSRGPDALAHIHANPDDDAALFESIGFAEVPGFLVRVVEPG